MDDPRHAVDPWPLPPDPEFLSAPNEACEIRLRKLLAVAVNHVGGALMIEQHEMASVAPALIYTQTNGDIKVTATERRMGS